MRKIFVFGPPKIEPPVTEEDRTRADLINAIAGRSDQLYKLSTTDLEWICHIIDVAEMQYAAKLSPMCAAYH